MTTIYQIKNKNNNKIYIGSTHQEINKRWNQHIDALNSNTHYNSYLQRSWNKHREDSFEFEIIEDNIPDDNQYEREQYYLDKLKSYNREIGYNLSKTATGVSMYGEDNHFYGKKHTEESKQKIREFRLGYTMSEETKNKIGESHKGDKNLYYGDNFKNSGIYKYWQNKNLSDEHKQKLKEKATGRKLSEETKNKLSIIFSGENNPRYGVEVSQETKEKISKSMKGKMAGSKNPRAIIIYKIHKITGDAVMYGTIKAASYDNNISQDTIRNHLKKKMTPKKYDCYFLKEDDYLQMKNTE